MNVHRIPRSARWRASLALVMVAALALTTGVALGSRQSGKATTITALIGSSGPAESYAVTNAAKAFTKQTGIQLNVIVASDLGQQLAQGFASGNPPDIFYLGNDQVATYAKAGDLAPRQPEERQVLLSEPPRGLHVPGPPVRSTEGLLDARARDQHQLLEGREADEQGLPDDLEAAGRGGEKAHPERPGRPVHEP